MNLDFTSLAISKEMAKQADLTMSPVLKQHVKPGTLSLDMWGGMQPNKEQEDTDDVISRAWRIQALQTCADSLLSAATRLEKHVRRETRYWDQVLSVSEKGWSLCRMPREKHNLGVRFGFLEAHGEYRDRGLAALRADEAGNVILDKGLRSSLKSIRVRTQRGSETVGLSKIIRAPVGSDSPLETRIRAARDSLYEEELFHEMIRESRTLASYGVNMRQSTISLPARLDARKTQATDSGIDGVSIDLICPDDASSDDEPKQTEHDHLAQTIAVVFRLLLAHTHRERLKRRSDMPQPMSLTKRDPTVAHILHPVLSVLHHRTVSEDLNNYLDRLSGLLSVAGIETSIRPVRLDAMLLDRANSIGSLMEHIMAPLRSKSVVTLNMPGRSDGLDFTLHLQTSSSGGALGSRMLLQSPIGIPELEMTEMEDVVDCLDALVANGLALGIADGLPGWSHNTRLGTVSEPGSDKKLSVVVQSGTSEGEGGCIVLDTGEARVEWRTENTEPDERRSFWDVVGDVVQRPE